MPLSHNEALWLNTGWETPADAWTKVRARADVLAEQTAELADLLEEGGRWARQPDGVTAISVMTGQVEELPAYRSVRFLPGPAARDRRPMLNALRLWLDRYSGARYVRYGVVTAGAALPAGGPLREVIMGMNRRISRWASEVREEFDIEVLYRGNELTRARRGDDEVETYHAHANVLYRPHRLLRDDEWQRFLTFSHDRLGAHWGDNGRVEDPAEIVKYIMKPDDLAGITSGEVGWLFDQTFKLRSATPMGAFRDYVRGLKAQRCKVVRVEGRLMEVEKAERLDHHREPDPERPRGGGGVPANTILGISLPVARHTRWAEPMMLVQRFDREHRTYEDLRIELEAARAAISDRWRQAGAPAPAIALAEGQALLAGVQNVVALRRAQRRDPYRVHNGRVTVRERSLFDAGGGGGEPPHMAEPDDALRPDTIPRPGSAAEVNRAAGGTGPTRRPALAGRAWGGPTGLPERAPWHGGVEGEEFRLRGPPMAA